jgi:hypothetical protein
MADNVTLASAEKIPPLPPASPHDRGRAHSRADSGIARALEDAACLLMYASQAGISIAPEVISAMVAARVAHEQGVLQPPVVQAFLSAYASLAAKLAPITADTVRESNARLGTVVRLRGWAAILTTALVVFASVVLFVTTSICTDINEGIAKANDMAATIRLHVGAPAIGNAADEKCGKPAAAANPPIALTPPVTEVTMVDELQQFAAAIRDLQTRALKLNGFVLNWETSQINVPNTIWSSSYDALQLDPALSNFRAAGLCKIAVYQEVRNFAQNVSADSSLFYGSLGKYVLPVLLALLGSLAYNLRDYTNRVRARTYHRSYLETARNIVAVIAGSIVGYFAGFAQGLSLLAAAFLVGYGVEIFFAFLDSMLVTFGAKKTVEAPAADAGRARPA